MFLTKNPSTTDGWIILGAFSFVIFIILGVIFLILLLIIKKYEKKKGKQYLIIMCIYVFIVGVVLIPSLTHFSGKVWSVIYEAHSDKFK